MAAGEVKKVRLRFVVLIYRILALFLCHQSCIQSFAYCFIDVWNSVGGVVVGELRVFVFSSPQWKYTYFTTTQM